MVVVVGWTCGAVQRHVVAWFGHRAAVFTHLQNQVHFGNHFSFCMRVSRDFGVDGAKTLWFKEVA